MIALDTNILVRFLTQDDPAQAAIAKGLLAHPRGVFIAKTVLLELEWVLRAAYKSPRENTHQALLKLLGLPRMSVEQPGQVAQALADYKAGFDFADAMHLAGSPVDEGLHTFDMQFARAAQTHANRVVLAGSQQTKP